MTCQLSKKLFQFPCASLFRAGFFCCAAIGAFSFGSAEYVFAQDEGRQFSAEVAEVINAPFENITIERIEDKIKALESLIETPNLNAFERSTIFQLLGKYSYELDRPGEAQRYFEQAIEAGDLLPDEVDNIRVVIAQIMIGNGQYREGARRLENYLNSSGDLKESYVELLVNAWVQAEDYRRALPWAEKWFNTTNPKERRHFDLLNFLFNNLGMQGRQADIVKEMINRWPEDKTLWDTWVYMLDIGGREQEAFEVTKMLYVSGMFNEEDELLKLIHYHAFYDMPYQGAEILEREMSAKRISKTADNLKTLGTLFRQAREYERAIAPLEAAVQVSGRKSQLKSDDLPIYVGLGEMLYKAKSCKKAKVAFEQAMALGYDAGKAKLHIGVCYAEQIANLEPLTCNMTAAQLAEAPRSKAREAALSALKTIPLGAPESADARKWIAFLEAEARASSFRCNLNSALLGDLCFQKIKQTYTPMILTGGFELEDESCREYKAEYDAKFVIKLTQD